MTVEKCEVPNSSVLDRSVIDGAYFRDSYRTRLGSTQATVVQVFHSVFGHHPVWMRYVLIVRNYIASWYGLEAPTSAEIMNPAIKSSYLVGDKIGPWPIFSLNEKELVAGRNNKHLDFRLSVLKETNGHGASAVISTVCTTHNVFGKIYLFFVIPFHKWGVQKLILRAHQAGRL